MVNALLITLAVAMVFGNHPILSIAYMLQIYSLHCAHSIHHVERCRWVPRNLPNKESIEFVIIFDIAEFNTCLFSASGFVDRNGTMQFKSGRTAKSFYEIIVRLNFFRKIKVLRCLKALISDTKCMSNHVNGMHIFVVNLFFFFSYQLKATVPLRCTQKKAHLDGVILKIWLTQINKFIGHGDFCEICMNIIFSFGYQLWASQWVSKLSYAQHIIWSESTKKTC